MKNDSELVKQNMELRNRVRIKSKELELVGGAKSSEQETRAGA